MAQKDFLTALVTRYSLRVHVPYSCERDPRIDIFLIPCLFRLLSAVVESLTGQVGFIQYRFACRLATLILVGGDSLLSSLHIE